MFPVFKCPIFRSPLFFKLDNSEFFDQFWTFFSRSPDEARKKPFDSKSVYNVDTDVDVDTDADVDVKKMKQKSWANKLPHLLANKNTSNLMKMYS